MKSKWFVAILPALMVAMLLIPLAVPGFASEETACVSESAAVPADEAAEENGDGNATDTDTGKESEIEEDTSTDCDKGIHHYRDGYGACALCQATPTPAPTAGDMSGNGSSGAEDVVSLVRFFLGNDDSICARPDVNGDGQFNLADIIYYLRYLMGDVETIVSDPNASPAYWREAATAD